MTIPAELVQRLITLGWLPGPTADPAAVKGAVRDYQTFHGLKPDGDAGPITLRHLDKLRFCGLAEHFTQEAVCAWPQRPAKITWNITGTLAGVSTADQKDAYALAWGYWSEVCGVLPEYVSNPSGANVLMGSGRIDGPQGTLAWSELPCGGARTLAQKYDDTEPWGIFEGGGFGKIDLVRVACHEIGHVIGIPHISAGNLLAPTYNQSIRKPQAGDIAEAVKRYGPPVNQPEPTPPGPPADKSWTVLESTLKAQASAMGYRLSKLA